MSTADAEEEDALRELEARRLRALVDGDIVIAGPLHADDYELIPPGGVPHSKEKYLSAVASGDLDYAVFEAASPVRVRLRGDTAILRYTARIGFGPDRSQDGLYWHTDYWERRDGRWQAVWSQATRRPPEAGD